MRYNIALYIVMYVVLDLFIVLLVFFALIFSVLFCFALRCLALLCFALHDLCCVVLFLVSWLRITLRCFALLCLLCTGKYRGSAGEVRWKYWGSAGEVRGKYGGSTGEVQGKYGGSTRECGGRGDYAEEPRIPGNFGQQATKLLQGKGGKASSIASICIAVLRYTDDLRNRLLH